VAISFSTLTEDKDSNDRSIYTTASVSPGANKLILLVVVNGRTDGTATAPSAISGNGLTWVQVGTVATSSVNQQVSLYRALGSVPSAGIVTITFAASQSNCLWSVFEVSGMDTSGTDGSGAIAQTPKTASATATTMSITLDSAITSGNASFAAFTLNASTVTVTPGSGYTQQGTGASATSPSIYRYSQYKAAGAQTIDATASQSAKYGIVGIELKALVVGAVVSKDLDFRWTTEAAAQGEWHIAGVGALGGKLDESDTGDTADAKDTGTRGFSGLVASRTYPGIFYFQPDHPQPDGRIYAVRLEEAAVRYVSGTTRYKKITVNGVPSDEDDWEDIAIDTSGKLYVWGNGGTNTVYRFPEIDPRTASSLSTTVDGTLDPPDGVGGSQESVGSCETIFWFNGDIYWINKVDPDSSRHKMWKRPAAGGAATYIGPIGVPEGGFGSTGRICGGDVSEDGKRVGIINKYYLFVYEGTTPTDAVSRAPVWKVDFKDPNHSQEALTEAVAFVPGTYDIYIMNEGTASGEAWFKYAPASAYGPGTPGQSATAATKSLELKWGVEASDDAAATGCMFGAHVQGSGFIEDSWEDTRKHLAVIRTYYEPTDWGEDVDDDDSTILALEQGRTVLVSHRHSTKGNGGWRSIAKNPGDDGYTATDDRYIDYLAKRYEPYGHRIVFIFNHEPHDDPEGAHKDGIAGNETPDYTAYRNAFRRVANRMHASGLLVGYCATASKALEGSPDGNSDLCYPGDSYIDVECHDHYNWWKYDPDKKTGAPRDWETPGTSEDKLLPLDDMAIRRGHPVIFGEWASHPTDGSKVRKTYFTQAATWIKTRPNIRGFCLYESDHVHNWLTEPDELSAFINDSYFSSTSLWVTLDDKPTNVAVGANVEFRWNLGAVAGKPLTFHWNVARNELAPPPSGAPRPDSAVIPTHRGPTRCRVTSTGRNTVG
jgi:cellulase (glycosyl hydrolase family 5)